LGRPRTPLISRGAATLAALSVIDAEGLEGFSLGAVARHMSVKAPSLYYHFRDKAELLSEVARHVLLHTGYRDDMAGDWEARTIALCVETRRALLKHPHAAPLILQFFPRHLLLDAYDRAVEGYPRTRALHMAILEGIEKLTFGDALFEAAARSRNMPAMPAIDPAKHPNLSQSVAANQMDEEGVFVEALRMFFAGVRVRTTDA
jgi:TetR/AcrR family transcriptional regulator, tetracycline repressor protein